jgi:hypothetical protein
VSPRRGSRSASFCPALLSETLGHHARGICVHRARHRTQSFRSCTESSASQRRDSTPPPPEYLSSASKRLRGRHCEVGAHSDRHRGHSPPGRARIDAEHDHPGRQQARRRPRAVTDGELRVAGAHRCVSFEARGQWVRTSQPLQLPAGAAPLWALSPRYMFPCSVPPWTPFHNQPRTTSVTSPNFDA